MVDGGREAEAPNGRADRGRAWLLLFPPDYFDQVADGLRDLVTLTADGLRQAARAFVRPPGAPDRGVAEIHERLIAARGTVPTLNANLKLADSALRFSPLVRGREAQVERYRSAVALASRAVLHASTLARAVRQHAERPHTWPGDRPAAPEHLVHGAEALALALQRYEEYVRTGAAAPLRDVCRELDRADRSLAEFVAAVDRERAGETATRHLVDIAAAASELEHLAGDLASTLGESSPAPKPNTVAARGGGT